MLSLREVRCRREVPFVALPLLFAPHQAVESLVWAGTEGDVSARVQSAAALVYVLSALPVLLFLVPLAVVLLEPRGARLRVAPFVVIGAVVGPSLLSGYPSIVAFGALNLVALIAIGLLYVDAFASLWCVFAATTSVLILLHMVPRRRLPDPHRLRGQALVA